MADDSMGAQSSEQASTGRVWHFRQPGDHSANAWDPGPLTDACETLLHDRRKQMSRIHLVFAYPHIPGGVGEVVAYAESLASDYGLRVACTAQSGMIDVTFERNDGRR